MKPFMDVHIIYSVFPSHISLTSSYDSLMPRTLFNYSSAPTVKAVENDECIDEPLPEIGGIRFGPVSSSSSSHTSSAPPTSLPVLSAPNSLALKPRSSFSSSSAKNSHYTKGNLEVGLENLGNSCFMNSALQCLFHIQPLVTYFLSGQYQQDTNSSSPYGGQLCEGFGHLIKDVFETKEGGVVSPVYFFKQLQFLAPHLVDYQQQDAQEFIRFLLDGLCEDLCRKRQSTDAVTKLKSSSSNDTNSSPFLPSLPTDRISMKASSLRNSDGKEVRRSSFRRSAQAQEDGMELRRTSAKASNPSEAPHLSNPSAPHLPESKSDAGFHSPRTTRRDVKNAGSSPSRPEVDNDLDPPSLAEPAPSDQLSIEDQARRAWDTYMVFNDSVIADIFAGQLQSTIVCMTCNSRSYCFDPFLDLPVPIPGKGQDTRSGSGFNPARLRPRITLSMSSESVRCSLEDCLQSFTAEEVLDGDNMISCEHCKVKRKGTKKLSVYKFPRVLVIQIKRFKMGKLSREKLTTDVVFPLKGLDLTPYLSGSTPINSSNPRPLYDLTGIAHHSGTMHGGHYVATCGVGQEGALKWVNFNDSKTTSVSVNNLSGPSAYVLFYKLQYDTK